MNTFSPVQLNSLNRQSGISLIEILITIIVLAIGMIGLAAMQNTSLKFSYDSYQRSQAAFLAYDLMDRVRANSGEVYGLSKNDTPASASCGATSNCSPSELRRADLYEWFQTASKTFPNAELEITGDGTEYTVRIEWESDRYENDAQDNETKQFVYQFNVQ